MNKAAQVTISVLFVVLLTGATLYYRWTRPAPPGQWVTMSHTTMATTLTYTVPRDAGLDGLQAPRRAFDRVETRMNEWKPESPLGRVNAGAGMAPVEVPSDLRELIERGIEIGEETGGAFDITWAALWGTWDFRAEEPAVPDAGAIAERVALVDYRAIEIDGDSVYLPREGMKIGLGGIAKGYALDLAAASLRQSDCDGFLLVIGGQVHAGGTKDGEPWRVGVRDPRGGPEELIATLEVSDASVSTSGDYERYFELSGVRYHHILDPRTGYPSDGARAVTVVCKEATMADVLSTTLMIVDASERESLCERYGAWALIVEQDGSFTEVGGPRPVVIFHD